MSVWLNAGSRILVQGITGSEGTKHTRRMVASGASIVAGVTPGKGGQTVDGGKGDIPVFSSVSEAVDATGADVSVVFVPPRFAKAAVVGATVTPGPSPVAKAAVIGAAVTPGRRRRI